MTHIIRQHYLDVEVYGTESDGLAVHRRLPDLCRDWLLPALERVLEDCAPPAGHLCIERLEIDAGTLSLDRLEYDLAEKVAQTLKKLLREYLSPRTVVGISHDVQQKTAQHVLQEAFLYFLQTGSLPWSFRLPAGRTLEQVILDSWQEAAQVGLKPLPDNDTVLRALSDPVVRRRLVQQFSSGFLETLLSLLSPASQDVLIAHPLWETMFAKVALSKTIIAEHLVREARELKTPVIGGKHPDAREGIYIDNAGLVLLHPFLPQFFAALGLAATDKLLQPDRALCLLHFLTTGQTRAPEYELVLPKILCNIPLSTPVETDLELTSLELEEAAALLQAVVRHWGALRNTSPDGLRGTFLLRPGKVSRRAGGDWFLQIETNAFDILLDQLPWGIAMIKLPWMEYLLRVDWR